MDLLNILIAKSMKQDNEDDKDENMTEEDKVLQKDDRENQKGVAL